jgi:zinc transport system substrate-binding protein
MTRSTALLIGLLVLITVSAVSCGKDADEPGTGEFIRVVTTTYPLAFMTERIGGDRIAITQLVKPGVEAHDFEPAPSDVLSISRADVFIFNHPSFEGWALNAVTASSSGGKGPAVAVQTIDGEADDSSFDAHVWLNPLKAQLQAQRILAALISADPDGTTEYERNAAVLKEDLQALDDLISARLSSCDLAYVVVSHLAFGHMAERYKFDQIGLAGLSPEFESGPSHLASVIEHMNSLGVRYILQEPIVSDRLAETIAAETGAELLGLHPLEVRTSSEAAAGRDYFAIMEANAESLATALGCS